MAKMKSMDALNAAIQSTKIPADYSNVQKLLGAVAAATTALNGLPSEYSRAYAQVQLLKYDENNNPQDVTPDEAISIPNSVIARYKQSWANIKSNIEALNALLHEQSENVQIVKGMTGFIESDVPVNDFSGMTFTTFKNTSFKRLLQAQFKLLSAKLFGEQKLSTLWGSSTLTGKLMAVNAALSHNPIICKDPNGNIFTVGISFQYGSVITIAMNLRVNDRFMAIGGVELNNEQIGNLTIYQLIGQFLTAVPSVEPTFSAQCQEALISVAAGAPADTGTFKSEAGISNISIETKQYVNSTVFGSINLQPLEEALTGL